MEVFRIGLSLMKSEEVTMKGRSLVVGESGPTNVIGRREWGKFRQVVPSISREQFYVQVLESRRRVD